MADYGIIGIGVGGQHVTATGTKTAEEALAIARQFGNRGFERVLVRDRSNQVYDLAEFERIVKNTGSSGA